MSKMISIEKSKKFENLWTIRNEDDEILAFAGNANDFIKFGAVQGKPVESAPWLIIYISGDIAKIDFGFTINEYLKMTEIVVNTWEKE